MKRIAAAVWLLICAGILAWWWLVGREPAAAQPAPLRDRAMADSAGRTDSGAQHRPESATRPDAEAGPAGEQAPQPPDYQALLRNADDYWEFAESVIDAARQGDPAAQYFLSNALAYCESLYDWYFVEHLAGGAVRTRTLDEALQFTATRRVFTPDDVAKLQKRCQRLRSVARPPFGTAREWLDAAITAQYPLAQTAASLDKAIQVRQQPTPEASRATSDEARRLALEALRTREPDAIARIGDVAANLASGDPIEAGKVQWVWRLAACLREPDCDSIAEWMQLFCNIDTQCQPFETPVDVIRRKAGNDYDEIERRARELNQKIDAGTLEAGDI